jgi:DNA-binding winged helix-turn-helix (wHTH) protein/TolB-like protein
MIYRFGEFELDIDKVELRASGRPCALEPQVFALLTLLVENRDRVLSRDEIIEKVWEGRIVSDAAVASRVKSLRQALGDDGTAQRLIRTVHGRGFRFVADVRAAAGAGRTVLVLGDRSGEAVTDGAGITRERFSRPSIAVLPFTCLGEPGPYAALAHALPHELITELARLRWLFVTARGSSFRLRVGDAAFEDIGRLLGVRYCLTGTLDVAKGRLGVIVELVDTFDGGVIWADRFTGSIDDTHAIRAEIRSRILAALEIRIPLHEAELARLAVPQDLDAWAAYHVGLQHMYRFNRIDNAAAAALFRRAIELNPRFPRAHAGLSFLHFQTAFLRHTNDMPGEIAASRREAERGLELDPLDPFVNFTMGRSFWLEGDLESSLVWLERATVISPNYAQGIYARAWTEALAGRIPEGRRHVDLAMRLSPLDPLYYAMLATRGLTHIALAEDAQAAEWAERAARSPGAHVLIAMIASVAHTLNDDPGRAAAWAANARERNPSLTRDDFFRAFPMRSDAMRSRVAGALARFEF